MKKRYNAEIELRSKDAIQDLEMLCPGTLLNNCSSTLWHERYVVRQETRGRVNPLEKAQPWLGKSSAASDQEQERHISEWALQLAIGYVDNVTLFGCTEDVQCEHAEEHKQDLVKPPFTRKLCKHCKVPVCTDCWKKLHWFKDGGSIPMSLANVYYYGYIDKYLVAIKVTWLEWRRTSS